MSFNIVYSFGNYSIYKDPVFGWVIQNTDDFYVVDTIEEVGVLDHIISGGLPSYMEDFILACKARVDELKLMNEKSLQRARYKEVVAKTAKEIFINRSRTIENIGLDLLEQFSDSNLAECKDPKSGHIYARVEVNPSWSAQYKLTDRLGLEFSAPDLYAIAHFIAMRWY